MTEEKKEITFYSDASHNYMVLECPQGFQDNYQYRMIAANQIRGLLQCSSRYIDESEYLYYDITSRQNLVDVYERRPVRGADLEKILGGLVCMENVLTEYLLDISHLILDPGCIYIDFREQECSFAYYPGERKELAQEEGGMLKLLTFLADHVDGRDKHAAALSYRLCMMAEKPGFRLRADMLEEMGLSCRCRNQAPAYSRNAPLFKKDDSSQAGGLFLQEDSALIYNGRMPGFGGSAPVFDGNSSRSGNGDSRLCSNGSAISGIDSLSAVRNSEYGSRDSLYAGRDSDYGGSRSGHGSDSTPYEAFDGKRSLYTGSGDETSAETNGQMRESTKRSKLKGRRLLIAGILLAAVGLALLALNAAVTLDEREMLLSRALGGLAGGTGILMLLWCLLQRCRKADRKKGKGEDTSTWWEDENFRTGKETAVRWEKDGTGSGNQPASRESKRDLQADRNLVPLWNGGAPAEGFSFSPEQTGFSKLSSAAAPASLGETSLLGPGGGEPRGLYGVGACRGEQISLQTLPCVVGKLQEYVDQVLDDGSVSRMHAKFFADRDGKMTVRDLNSTNGTWLNGERLKPNESRTLEQGDHIRLGRMEFVFR